MVISEKQIKGKKRIGSLDGSPVLMLECKGGLFVVATHKKGGIEALGMGSHAGLARFIAEQKEPDLKLLELSKSEQVDRRALEALAPKYEQLTAVVNEKIKNYRK